MRDLYNLLAPVRALTPATIQNTTAGANISTAGYDGVLFSVDVSNFGDAMGGGKSFEFDVQESYDNGTTWVAAADQSVEYAVGTANGAANTGAGALLNSGAAGTGAQVLKIGYVGNAPNVRLDVLVAGGPLATGTEMSAQAILGFPRHAPAGVAQLP